MGMENLLHKGSSAMFLGCPGRLRRGHLDPSRGQRAQAKWGLEKSSIKRLCTNVLEGSKGTTGNVPSPRAGTFGDFVTTSQA